LSFRKTARALEPFAERSDVTIWEWVQKFDPKRVYPHKWIAAFLIDETQMQIGGTEAWLLVAIERIHRAILAVLPAAGHSIEVRV
jgi:putative transposase